MLIRRGLFVSSVEMEPSPIPMKLLTALLWDTQLVALVDPPAGMANAAAVAATAPSPTFLMEM